jgi:hypothetical protein
MDITDTQTTSISKSKYELTLAEFPIFLLSRSKDDAKKVIEYKDQITGKGGKMVDREWKVYPSAFGFGTESTFSTLFELFQIWKEDNFEHQTIRFSSVYNILKRKGMDTGNQQYKQIIRDLECLVGITIKAKNAFWDNEVKAYVDMAFHLFDRYELFKEKPNGQATLPLAQIKASDVLYGSILKNSLLIAGFDSKFFHSLKPLEQRLAIYLSKIFRSQTMHKRDLMKFAEQVPIYAKQKKHIKLQIKRSCTGLMEKGFNLLESFEFEKGLNKQEFIVFKRNGALPKAFTPTSKKGNFFGNGMEQSGIDFIVEDILAVCEDSKSIEFYKKIARTVPESTIYRALSEVKETRDLGEIKKSKGALFTNLIKKYAQEQGIEI